LDEGRIHFAGPGAGVLLGAIDQAMKTGVVAPLGQFDVPSAEQRAFAAPEAKLLGFEFLYISHIIPEKPSPPFIRQSGP
jgi:hypothetical protein